MIGKSFQKLVSQNKDFWRSFALDVIKQRDNVLNVKLKFETQKVLLFNCAQWFTLSNQFFHKTLNSILFLKNKLSFFSNVYKNFIDKHN